jgi:hypothetical protein
MTDNNSIEANLLISSTSCGGHESISKLQIPETWSTHSSVFTIFPIKAKYFQITLSLWTTPDTPELWRILSQLWHE